MRSSIPQKCESTIVKDLIFFSLICRIFTGCQKGLKCKGDIPWDGFLQILIWFRSLQDLRTKLEKLQRYTVLLMDSTQSFMAGSPCSVCSFIPGSRSIGSKMSTIFFQVIQTFSKNFTIFLQLLSVLCTIYRSLFLWRMVAKFGVTHIALFAEDSMPKTPSKESILMAGRRF